MAWEKEVSWEDMDKLIYKLTSSEIDEHASSNRLVYCQIKENEVKRAKEKLALQLTYVCLIKNKMETGL